MIVKFVCAAAICAVVSSTSVASASAASLLTDAFLTNANQDVDFLDRASRLALTNAGNAKIKAFALSQARDQTLVANAIGDWITADLGTKSGNGEQTVTGRSVAVDGTAAPLAHKIAEMGPPAGQEDIDNLEGLTGKDFDDIYKARERATLAQLSELYSMYASSGDDHALVAIASRELPKIKRQIAELGAL